MSFNQPIGTKVLTLQDGQIYKVWDVSHVTNMTRVFQNAKNLNFT